MKTVLIGYLATLRFLKRISSLPKMFGASVARVWRGKPLHAAEAERLDRLRNPLKYLGKP